MIKFSLRIDLHASYWPIDFRKHLSIVIGLIEDRGLSFELANSIGSNCVAAAFFTDLALD